jgi:hypothetical protein
MLQDFSLTQIQCRPMRRRSLYLALLCVASLSLGGCYKDFAGFNCKKVRADVLQVGPNASCRFRYGHSDIAKYVVVITRAPIYGEASGQGQYLRYVAKPGFVGEDRLSIKVVRRGVGHVQWQDLTVKVKVGSDA